jgi:hypothetical protein
LQRLHLKGADTSTTLTFSFAKGVIQRAVGRLVLRG